MQHWKQFLLFHLAPFVIAIVCLFLVIFLNAPQTDTNAMYRSTPETRYIDNFTNQPLQENVYRASEGDDRRIFILGSSELTGATEATPYNFISDHYNVEMIGVGHAGNQCFSIYSQLLANRTDLKNAEIVIVLSPGWFYGSPARGTTSQLFLEYNSSHFIHRVLTQNEDDPFRKYEAKRVSDYYGDFVSPDLAVKLLHFGHQSERSYVHAMVYRPLMGMDRMLQDLRSSSLFSEEDPLLFSEEKERAIKEELPEVQVNWDSLFQNSLKEQYASATNNTWYIENGYYNEYVKGKTSKVHLVPEEKNQELEDFRMLVSLLSESDANASFIILPLNPWFYSNLKELTPLVSQLESEAVAKGFPCLNFWNEDTTKFEKGILSDVMHLSKYGWYKADRFILDTYHLEK